MPNFDMFTTETDLEALAAMATDENVLFDLDDDANYELDF